jgi:hypothetical protein
MSPAPKPDTRSCPLNRVYRPENARERFSVFRVFLQTHQLPVQPVQVFVALQQEFANYFVVHAFILHLFRFGTRRGLLRSAPTVLPVFLSCAHTIPSPNARLPTFPVHPTFQHDSFHRSCCQASFIVPSNSPGLSSLLFSSIHTLFQAPNLPPAMSFSSLPFSPPFQLGSPASFRHTILHISSLRVPNSLHRAPLNQFPFSIFDFLPRLATDRFLASLLSFSYPPHH